MSDLDLYYILDENGNPKGVKDVLEWAKWLEVKGNRNIARDNNINGYDVSTIFTGIDTFGTGRPTLYETMIFNNNNEGHVEYEDRYSTKKEAIDGHAKAIEMAQRGKFD